MSSEEPRTPPLDRLPGDLRWRKCFLSLLRAVSGNGRTRTTWTCDVRARWFFLDVDDFDNLSQLVVLELRRQLLELAFRQGVGRPARQPEIDPHRQPRNRQTLQNA